MCLLSLPCCSLTKKHKVADFCAFVNGSVQCNKCQPVCWGKACAIPADWDSRVSVFTFPAYRREKRLSDRPSDRMCLKARDFIMGEMLIDVFECLDPGIVSDEIGSLSPGQGRVRRS